MAEAYVKFTLTEQGESIIARVVAGLNITFKRIAIGDGYDYDTENFKSRTELVNEVKSLDNLTMQIVGDDQVELSAKFAKTDITSSFWYREIGIYIVDPDNSEEEILYGYGNMNDKSQYITPDIANYGVLKNIKAYTKVGSSTNVNIYINTSQTTTEITNCITNCITEVPQRVKCTVEGNTLTTLSDSIVILPYGTEDKTEDYPIGSTFIGDFTVYDTQYTDGKFFIWLKVSANKSISPSTNAGQRFAAFEMNTGNSTWNAITNCFSGATAPTSPVNGVWWYDTTNNLIKRYSNSTWENYYITLPHALFITDGTTLSLLKTFNGSGFIGSHCWLDKGVKGLAAIGLNTDGTYKNEPFITSKLNLVNLSILKNAGSYNLIVFAGEGGAYGRNVTHCLEGPLSARPTTMPDNYAYNYYATDINKLYYTQSGSTTPNWQEGTGLIVDNFYFDGTRINLNKGSIAFQAADAQDIDGRWIYVSSVTLVSGATYPTSTDTIIDLSNLLPKDNNVYECILVGNAITGAASGNYVNIMLKSQVIPATVDIISVRTQTNASTRANGNCILPVGPDKKITVQHNNIYVGTYNLFLRAYRKVR